MSTSVGGRVNFYSVSFAVISKSGFSVNNFNKINFLRGLANHFSYDGLVKGNWTAFIKGFVCFFLFLLNVRRGVSVKSDLHVELDEYIHKFAQDSNFKNLNFLLNLLYLKYGVGFRVVCVEVDKKYRKKLQTRYVMKLTYLTTHARKKHFFRIFNSFVINTKTSNTSMRVFDVFCGGILSGNRSFFYSYKKTVFKYLLRSK